MSWIEALQFGFVQRALLAGSFIAVCCACLGVFLVLRKLSLIGEGISHFSFATIGLGLLLGVQPLVVTIPLVVMASLWILYLAENTNVYGDAAIGLVSAVGVAIGVILASRSGGFNIDLFSYLFGDILAVATAEVWGTVVLSILVLAAILFFYQELLILAFDEEYAKVLGVRTRMINRVLIVLAALTIVLGIKVVGIMLVSSLIILPAMTALQLGRAFKSVLIYSMAISVVSVVIGILLAFTLNLPAGAAIVLLNFTIFLIVYIIKAVGRH